MCDISTFVPGKKHKNKIDKMEMQAQNELTGVKSQKELTGVKRGDEHILGWQAKVNNLPRLQLSSGCST